MPKKRKSTAGRTSTGRLRKGYTIKGGRVVKASKKRRTRRRRR